MTEPKELRNTKAGRRSMHAVDLASRSVHDADGWNSTNVMGRSQMKE